MKTLFLRILNQILRGALRLRYKIAFKNFDAVKKLAKENRPIIFLPSHPAEVDPIILFTELFPKFAPRGLVVEYFYHLSGANWLMKTLKTIPMPDFDVSVTEWKKKRGEAAYQKIVEGLKNKENFMIYPSGQLKRTCREKIGGSSMVHRLLNEVQDVNIVLVRINGLWGSSFSRGITGLVDPFWKLIINGVKTLIKNGIFFTPRRKVTVEFVINPKDLPIKLSKVQFNRYLERFYNQYVDATGKVLDEEPLSLVSYAFWKNQVPTINYQSQHESKFSGKISISEKEKKLIIDQLKELLDDKEKEIHENDHLSHQLGLDSLDVANIYTTVCKTFDVHLKIEPGDIRTVRDLFYIASQKETALSERNIQRDPIWIKKPNRPMPHIPQEETIGAAFIKKAKELGNEIACKDATTQAISYKRLLMTALILKGKFTQFKEEKIGVMLPASVGGYAIILGLLLAKKTPVMINWTVGARVLKHAKELLGLKTILTSEKFLDKMTLLDISPIENEIVLMEDIRRQINLGDKLSALFTVKKSANRIIKNLGLKNVDKKSPAVILFTSGTESNPKAVPLSHENILKNLEASLDQIDLLDTDILYGTLPPFHSFGFSITGLFPILAGIRVFFAPDPTDSAQMAYDIEEYLPTMICLAPSFYKNLFKVAKNHQLKSIRLFVSGAEKAPLELLESVKILGEEHQFLEGYGITECSPVVSINLPDRLAGGVGLPLPNLTIKIIHPETLEEIDSSLDGEICIHGPSVFERYIGDGKKDPFIILDGKKFYRSGDIGHIDPTSYDLILSGRLKRFVKIGGEMVSLGAIESELQEKFKKKDFQPIFVVCPLEADAEKTRLAVMSNVETSKDELNEILKLSGFGRIVKIFSHHYMEKIPVMGTGKIDYRRIDDIIKTAMNEGN